MTNYYQEHREERILYQEKYNQDHRDEIRLKRRGRQQKVHSINPYRDPIKERARRKLRWAVDSGKLVRLPCLVCGNPKSEGHHEDYNKPLEVVWLCRIHHEEVHHAYQNAQSNQGTKNNESGIGGDAL
jgi:hypothetical protein